jgi:hypothetical protein
MQINLKALKLRAEIKLCKNKTAIKSEVKNILAPAYKLQMKKIKKWKRG